MTESAGTEGTRAAQRRGRRISTTAPERDDFLKSSRTCRVATVGADGAPHLSALWFIWDGTAIWLNSIVASQRWTDISRDRRISVLVDDGEHFTELRGVEVIGTAQPVGEVPRTGELVAELESPESAFGAKYAGAPSSTTDAMHGSALIRSKESAGISANAPDAAQRA